jgi:hypothetical protein
MVILDSFNIIFKTELLIVFCISFGSILFGGYCTDSQCTASGMQAGCDAATGCTSVSNCNEINCCRSLPYPAELQQFISLQFETEVQPVAASQPACIPEAVH